VTLNEALTRSNRTIVGLKHDTKARPGLSPLGSNRTIVGLKLLKVNDNAAAIYVQQSHHCGIETWLERFDKNALAAQQSHHCGIETM